MIDFDFVSPTKIFFGKNKEENIGDICNSYGYKKVFIIIGQGSVKRIGLLDKVINSLANSKVDYQILEGVRANPTIQLCKKGINLIREYNPDCLLAIGGGSVIDTAKNMAVGYYYDGDSFDFNRHIANPTKALPIGVILTISAAGSEMSNSCVVQDDATNMKLGFNSDIVRPVFAIENPELTYSVSKEQTAYGIVDMMMHTLGRYDCASTSENEPADRFAEGLLRSVIEAGKVVMENPCDYEARSVLMLMSSLSHNGFTGIGKPYCLIVHSLEMPLSAVYPDVAHGAGMALLYPKWCRYYLKYDYDKFDRLGREVFGLKNEDPIKNAEATIDAIDDYFTFLGMPKTYKDLGIENVDIDALVKAFSPDGTRKVGHRKKPMDINDAREIFSMCI